MSVTESYVNVIRVDKKRSICICRGEIMAMCRPDEIFEIGKHFLGAAVLWKKLSEWNTLLINGIQIELG